MYALQKRGKLLIWSVLILIVLYAGLAHAFTAQAEEQVKVNLSVPIHYWNSVDPVEGYEISLKWYGDGWIPWDGQPSNIDGNITYNDLMPGYPYRLMIMKNGYYQYDEFFYLTSSRTIPVTLIPMTEPHDLSFMDEDMTAGQLSGYLEWTAPDISEGAYTHFGVYFVDKEDQIIGTIVHEAGKDEHDSYRVFDTLLIDMPIPAGAQKLRVYKYTEGDPSSLRATPAETYIWDLPTALPQKITMIDNDPAPGEINGTVYWDPADGDTGDSEYVLLRTYYSDVTPEEMEIVGSVPSGQYSYPIRESFYEYPRLYYIALSKNGYMSNLVAPVAISDNISEQPGLSGEVDPEITAPGNPVFTDLDSAANQIGGTLSWTYPEYRDNFEVYFLNVNNQVVGSLISAYFDFFSGYGSGTDSFFYSVRIPDHTPIPAGATHLGVYMKNIYVEGEFPELSKPAVVPINDLIPPKSQNADLAALTTDPAITLTPSFSSSVKDYTATVSSSVYSIKVSAKAADAHATVVINGAVVPSEKTVEVNLVQGQNPIPIIVTAEDGMTTKNYNLLIIKNAPLSADTQLGSLTLGGGFSLTPGFSRNEPNYTTEVSSVTTSITVTAAVYDSRSRVRINNSAESVSVTEVVYLNGSVTPVTITVKAQDGTIGTYSILVKRPVLAIGSGSGAFNGSRLEGISSGTTVDALLSRLTLPSGITAKVTDRATGATIGKEALIDSSMKLVLLDGIGSTVSAYEVKLLGDMIREATGAQPGSKLQFGQLIQFITSPNKTDLTGDGQFNAADVRKVLLELAPVK
ncbi:cadherin-like beta sandwich domain-containing protein [Paenibacillus piri]|uniref:Cadherin-like beta sandwich domain-containing protein n=1 Tax=Paenibacillus piri TaxID=2547395 RepID=A0A4R5KMA6_9BACL|nr:cadherin-like beta sandwich domain-containing protein [Paenibacillus piri]TDF96362.1 cadherin-like beta sandwich domain-containing protein [Paenibacillus piri]